MPSYLLAEIDRKIRDGNALQGLFAGSDYKTGGRARAELDAMIRSARKHALLSTAQVRAICDAVRPLRGRRWMLGDTQ